MLYWFDLPGRLSWPAFERFMREDVPMMADADVRPVRTPGYALLVWSAPFKSWACVAVSERREVIDGLCERMRMLVPAIFEVVVASSVEDDDVVLASENLRKPDAQTVYMVQVEQVGFRNDSDYEIPGVTD